MPCRAIGRGRRGRCRRGGARSQPAWAERTAVARGDVVRDVALLLREQREQASEIVVEETGKPLGLARGETDAAVEMGLFIAGEGRRSYGRDDGVDASSHRHDRRAAARRRRTDHELQPTKCERRVESVPGDLLRQHRRREAVEHTPASASFFAEPPSRPVSLPACSTSCTGSVGRPERSSTTRTSTS